MLELRRLKNIKRAELESKLKVVHDVAGIGAEGLLDFAASCHKTLRYIGALLTLSVAFVTSHAQIMGTLSAPMIWMVISILKPGTPKCHLSSGPISTQTMKPPRRTCQARRQLTMASR
eukprot:SAG22_NODE_1615_length_3986_cov_3.960895_3_plen_118_part_00